MSMRSTNRRETRFYDLLLLEICSSKVMASTCKEMVLEVMRKFIDTLEPLTSVRNIEWHISRKRGFLGKYSTDKRRIFNFVRYPKHHVPRAKMYLSRIRRLEFHVVLSFHESPWAD
jgi:hypothetical protein